MSPIKESREINHMLSMGIFGQLWDFIRSFRYIKALVDRRRMKSF